MESKYSKNVAEGLPEMCFSVMPGTGELICIKRGESGYYRSDWNTRDKERNIQIRDDANESLGVTTAQRKAMEAGSMFGWGVPGADPARYAGNNEVKLTQTTEDAFLEEACRQWYAFIQEDSSRSDGVGFASFYREIREQLLVDPDFMEACTNQNAREMGGMTLA